MKITGEAVSGVIGLLVAAYSIFVLIYSFISKIKKSLDSTSRAMRGIPEFDEAIQIARGGYDYPTTIRAAISLGEASKEDWPQAVKALVYLADDSQSPDLIAAALVSLGKIGSPEIIVHIQKHLDSSASAADEQALSAMRFKQDYMQAYGQRIGATVSQPSLPDLQEKHKRVRECALWAIQSILERSKSKK